MAFDYKNAFKRIIAKTDILKQRYEKMHESRDEALAQAEMLKAELEKKDKEIEKLKMQVEYLQLASTISLSREQIDQARAMITGLVRDIDRCIADLSD